MERRAIFHTQATGRQRTAGRAGGHIDIVWRRVVAGTQVGATVAIRQGDKDARLPGVDQRLIDRIERAAAADRAAAPGVIDHVGAIFDYILQGCQHFGGVGAFIGVDAGIEDTIAHDVGAWRHAADGADIEPLIAGGDNAAGRNPGCMQTV